MESWMLQFFKEAGVFILPDTLVVNCNSSFK